MKVGLLPASGKASRIGGIQKFALPISNEMSLLEWHLRQLEEVADVVRISTRKSWIPILKNMNLGSAEIFIREPSTMSDAINLMVTNISDQHVVGMPDTFISSPNRNFYSALFQSSSPGALALWKCPESLRGKVGQVLLNQEGKILDLLDKVDGCEYEWMWGAFTLSNLKLHEKYPSPSSDFKDWITGHLDITGMQFDGTYIDAGTFIGILDLYKEIADA